MGTTEYAETNPLLPPFSVHSVHSVVTSQMSSPLQTILALGLVALAATLLVRSWIKKGKNPGCSSEGCGAVSSEVKKLQARLKR